MEFAASDGWRQVGRFALAWDDRQQQLTDGSRRAELVKALRAATADAS
ncbi:hypothetical protein ACL02U_25475 [Streptomyces sp. MS06]